MKDNTKKLLSDSLKELLFHKELKQISIKELTESCGLNRQTFYYHFSDIYDLVEWTILSEVNFDLPDSKDWKSMYQMTLDKLVAKKPMILNLYNSVGTKWIIDIMLPVIQEIILQIVDEKDPDKNINENDRRLITNFYTSGVVGNILLWLEFGMNQHYYPNSEIIFSLIQEDLTHMIAVFTAKNEQGVSSL